jgi:general secretion pathway protein G
MCSQLIPSQGPSRRHRRGFTLVEILVVVIILGILAAIVVPQYTSANDAAHKNTLGDQLRSLRQQVQLYKVQHDDNPPPLTATSWDALVQQSTFMGQTFGPYIQAAPRNGVNNFSNIAIVASDPNNGDPVSGTDIGFVYNPSNGGIWATNRAGTAIYNELDPNDPNN